MVVNLVTTNLEILKCFYDDDFLKDVASPPAATHVDIFAIERFSFFLVFDGFEYGFAMLKEEFILEVFNVSFLLALAYLILAAVGNFQDDLLLQAVDLVVIATLDL